MFAMLNFRIVAALIAFELLLTTVLFRSAGPLLGLAVGAAAGAAVFAAGRYLLAPTQEDESVDNAATNRFHLISSVAAFTAVASFYFVIAGGISRWLAVAVLGAALVVLGVASVRLNRLVTPLPSSLR